MAFALAAALVLAISAQAQPLAVGAAGKTRDLAELIENAGRLHYDVEHPWLQELWLLGRYNGQYFSADGPAEESHGWEHRRARIGAQARLFNKLTLHAQLISGTDFEPRFNGATELWAQWSFNQALTLGIGQQKHRFTHERNTSSRYLNTAERTLLVNMVGMEYTPSVTLAGRIGKWSYHTGIFSDATYRDLGRAFTEFDSGWSCITSLTVDLGQALGTDTAHLNLGVLHSEAEASATNLNRWRNGLSSALILTSGPASLILEGMCLLDSPTGDAAGFYLQPSYFITDRLQVAARYQFSASNDDGGLVAQRRYERTTGLATGSLYQAGYLGLNYHLAGHRAKIMAGIEYARLSGVEAWTGIIVVRLFWGPHASGPFPMGKTLPGALRSW